MLLMFVAAITGVTCVAEAAWIHVKARMAQGLIGAAWDRAQTGVPDSRPWSWADTTPVAKLKLLRRGGAELIVLEGASGRNLAFGPTHDSASVLPGERGNSVISGHRDTHFHFLRDVSIGDRLQTQLADGRSSLFAITDIRVVDRDTRIHLDSTEPRLTLVTCWPIDAVRQSPRLRLVVTADWVADANAARQ